MTACTDETINIVDMDDTDGQEVSRWECSACHRHGHWTPARERPLIVIRGHAHTLRTRRKRPTKAQLEASKGKGRVVKIEALRDVLSLGGGF